MDRRDYLNQLDFSSRTGLNGKLISMRYAELAQFFRGKTCLELGSADGEGTGELLSHFSEVVAVDGAANLVAALRASIADPRLQVHHSLFEDLHLGRTFDTVLLGHILEHVDHPQVAIDAAVRHLAPGGVLIADVPNADSVHRQMGVKLGLLQQVTDLNEADLRIGHQRVYRPSTFRAEFERRDLVILREGGYFLKFLSNAQLEKILDDKQLIALFELGCDHPAIAADIYVISELA